MSISTTTSSGGSWDKRALSNHYPSWIFLISILLRVFCVPPPPLQEAQESSRQSAGMTVGDKAVACVMADAKKTTANSNWVIDSKVIETLVKGGKQPSFNPFTRRRRLT